MHSIQPCGQGGWYNASSGDNGGNGGGHCDCWRCMSDWRYFPLANHEATVVCIDSVNIVNEDRVTTNRSSGQASPYFRANESS